MGPNRVEGMDSIPTGPLLRPAVVGFFFFFNFFESSLLMACSEGQVGGRESCLYFAASISVQNSGSRKNMFSITLVLPGCPNIMVEGDFRAHSTLCASAA